VDSTVFFETLHICFVGDTFSHDGNNSVESNTTFFHQHDQVVTPGQSLIPTTALTEYCTFFTRPSPERQCSR